jgi:hypothetical protein
MSFGPFPRRRRRVTSIAASAVAALALTVGVAACSTSGHDAAASPTTASTSTTTAGRTGATSTTVGVIGGGASSDPATVEACLTAAKVGTGLDWSALFDDDNVDRSITVIDRTLGCTASPSTDARLETGFAAAFGHYFDVDVDATAAACILDHVAANATSPGATLVDPASAEEIQDLVDAGDACAPESLADDLQAAVQGPMHLGDAAELDGITTRCKGGSNDACDLLFDYTSPGSEYHEIGETCGGRRPDTDEFCGDGYVLDDDGNVTSTAPVLDRLATTCRTGDALACDLLYQISPPDSTHETLGWTCNGRFPKGRSESCLAGR